MDSSFLQIAQEAVEMMSKSGAFLVTKNNVMTIGWGTAGIMWNKPVFMAPVRLSRATHSIMEKNADFIVCLPFEGQMEDELEFCGTKSGRDVNKIKDLEFTMLPSKKASIPYIGGCKCYLECKVLSRTNMVPERNSGAVNSKWYTDGDMHTLYFGEIIAAYKADNIF